MRKGFQQRIDAHVTDTCLNPDGALSRRGRETFRIDEFGNDIAKTQTPQARTGEKRPVDFSGVQLTQPRLDIAAENHHLKVRTKAADQSLTAQ